MPVPMRLQATERIGVQTQTVLMLTLAMQHMETAKKMMAGLAPPATHDARHDSSYPRSIGHRGTALHAPDGLALAHSPATEYNDFDIILARG